MNMKVLITGVTGMVGSHLADYILADHPGVEVHGLVRWRSPLENIAHLGASVRLHLGDLRDLNSLVRIMREVRPDRIFHLAAQSFVPASFTAPGRYPGHQRGGHGESAGCHPPRRPGSPGPHLQFLGGLRPGPGGRTADPGSEPLPAGQPLRGFQGGRGTCWACNTT